MTKKIFAACSMVGMWFLFDYLLSGTDFYEMLFFGFMIKWFFMPCFVVMISSFIWDDPDIVGYSGTSNDEKNVSVKIDGDTYEGTVRKK
jgi:hypothetical protein